MTGKIPAKGAERFAAATAEVAGASPAYFQSVAAGTAASTVANKYPYPKYNRNRPEWSADGRDSPTLIPVD
jgi:hypothetical protein